MKKCRNCGSASLVTTQEDRPLDSLPDVIIGGLKITRCQDCGAETISIPRLEELHRVVATALIRKRGPLMGREVRYLRKWLGWSGKDFARHFDLTPEHISRVENDHHPISGLADRLLRLRVMANEPRPDYSPDEILDIGDAAEAHHFKVEAHNSHWNAVA